MAFSFSSYQKSLGVRSPIGDVEFEFTGDWVKLDKFLRYLSGRSTGLSLKRDLAKAQRDWLQRYKIKLVGGLLSEGTSVGMPFEEHSPGYSRPGFSVGHKSGVYLDALRNLRIIQKGYSVSLTYSPGDLNRKSFRGGYRLNKYALIFEGGKWNQPARPLWNATYSKMGGHRNLTKNLLGAIGKRLDKLGIR